MTVAIAKAVRQQDERIEQLLSQSEGRFRRAIQNNLSQITDGRRFNRIERLIQQGEYEQAINESARIVAETVEGEFITTYTTGGFEAASFVQGAIGLQVNFNQVNQRAISQLQQENLRLVTNFTQQQRAASLAALQDGFQRGLNPRQTAIQFRDSIGLTGNQQRAVSNYRRALEDNSARALQYNLRDRRFDSTTRRAIDTGQPLSQAEIDRNVQRYRERALRHRSEVIARTESLRSLNMGLREGFQQQIDNGNLDRNQLKRRWVTARDERVRESHSPMHGQERAWDEPFTSGAGVTLMHPGDPNAPGSETIQCRCIATTRIDPTREQSQQARSMAQAEARQQQPRRQQAPSARSVLRDNKFSQIPDYVDIESGELNRTERIISGNNRIFVSSLAEPIGQTSNGRVPGYGFSFDVNNTYNMGTVADPREAGRAALRIRQGFNRTVATLPDGSVVFNSPWSADGSQDDRIRIYRRFGFGEYDERTESQFGVVYQGKILPISRQDLEREFRENDITSMLEGAT